MSTTTTTEHSNTQTTTRMHRLDANATSFDPISNSVGGQMDGNKQFTLFTQLQQLNTVSQQLQYQLNNISIPTLTQLNQQLLNANLNQLYIKNPIYYSQLQQQQNTLLQTVQFQQNQFNQTQNHIDILRNQYKLIQQEEMQKLTQQNSPIQTPQNNNTPETNEQIIDKSPAKIQESKQDENIIKTDDKSMEREEEFKEEIEEKVIERDGEIEYNEPAIAYSVENLLKHQCEYMDIDWINNQHIPRDIRIIYKNINQKEFMNDIIASITRKCEKRFYDRKIAQDKKTICMRKLQMTLNKMTPTKFEKISLNTMDIINEYVMEAKIGEFENGMDDILGMILEFGITQSIFSDQYAKLIHYIFHNLEDISHRFRSMVIMESNKLFNKYNKNKLENKKEFIAFLKLCGDLYNINMMKSSLIYKGIIDKLITNDCICIDIEAICMLFKECGNKLDVENTNLVSKYLKRIKRLSKMFDFRTQCLVDGIVEMRATDWTHRIKKEKPKHLNEIKKEHEQELEKIENAKYGHGYKNGYKNGYNKYDYGRHAYENANYGRHDDYEYNNNQNNHKSYSRYK